MIRKRIGDAEETALTAQATIQHNRFHKMDPLNEPLRFCFLSALLISQALQGFRLNNESVLRRAEKESNSPEIICVCVQILPIRLLPWRSLPGSTAQATLWESSG